jgi:hypothetical protein
MRFAAFPAAAWLSDVRIVSGVHVVVGAERTREEHEQPRMQTNVNDNDESSTSSGGRRCAEYRRQ